MGWPDLWIIHLKVSGQTAGFLQCSVQERWKKEYVFKRAIAKFSIEQIGEALFKFQALNLISFVDESRTVNTAEEEEAVQVPYSFYKNTGTVDYNFN